MNSYMAGSLIRVTAAFTSISGTAADPTAVTLSYQPYPGATVTAVAYPASPVVRDGRGQYHADLDTTGSPGDVFTYMWTGTGDVQAAAEGTFIVKVPFA